MGIAPSKRGSSPVGVTCANRASSESLAVVEQMDAASGEITFRR